MLRANGVPRRLEHSWQQLHENCVDSGELDEQRWALYSLLRRRDRIAYEQQRIAEVRLEKLSKAVNKIHEKQNCHEQGTQELIERRNELHERRERWRLRLLKQQQLTKTTAADRPLSPCDHHCLALRASLIAHMLATRPGPRANVHNTTVNHVLLEPSGHVPRTPSASSGQWP